jgi:hypothetical protein
MGRSPINLEPYKEEIIQLVRDGLSSTNIAAHVRVRHGFTVSERTIKSRLKEWGTRRRNQAQNSNMDSALHDRVKTLFFEYGLEDKEMFRVLQDEGFQISLRSLGKLRRSLNLRRRENPIQAEQRTAELRAMIREELAKGTIAGYGKKLLHRHFRSLGVIVSR